MPINNVKLFRINEAAALCMHTKCSVQINQEMYHQKDRAPMGKFLGPYSTTSLGRKSKQLYYNHWLDSLHPINDMLTISFA